AIVAVATAVAAGQGDPCPGHADQADKGLLAHRKSLSPCRDEPRARQPLRGRDVGAVTRFSRPLSSTQRGACSRRREESPEQARARAKIVSIIFAVSRPVNVFCWLG